jgi:hypothetical protein
MKQSGKPADQYSQAAYQGYINNMKQAQNKPKPSAPSSPAPQQLGPPVQDNTAELQSQIQDLTNQIQNQADSFAESQKKPQRVNASNALAPTILTGVGGIQDQNKKKKNFLQGGLD